MPFDFFSNNFHVHLPLTEQQMQFTHFNAETL